MSTPSYVVSESELTTYWLMIWRHLESSKSFHFVAATYPVLLLHWLVLYWLELSDLLVLGESGDWLVIGSPSDMGEEVALIRFRSSRNFK